MNYLRITDFKNKDSQDYCGAFMIECTKKERDFTEDYILPDYLPDAKKILRFVAKPVIETRFIGSSGLEYSGSIYCRALYLAEDSTIRCASFTIPFEDRLSSENLTDECVDFLSPTIISPICRLQNPRKMNIRMKLSSSIEVFKGSSTMPEVYGGTGREEKHIQTNIKSVPSMNVTCIREDDLSVSEDIALDKSNPDIAEIIFTDAEAVFDECRSSGTEILCRGSVTFECIYRCDSNNYHFIRRSIPISESLVGDVIPADCSVFALCRSKTPEVTVLPDEFGLKRIIELDLSYGVEICCKKEKELLYASDAFSINHEIQNSISPITVHRPEYKILSGFTVGESLKAEDCSLGKEDTVLAFFLNPEMSLQNTPGKHGKLYFEGQCEITVIANRPENPPRSQSFFIPLRFESDRPFMENVLYSDKTVCRASDPRIRFDGENLYADFELSISSDITASTEINAISAIRLLAGTEKTKGESSVITVYYPSSSECEWDIAKKYSITRESLALHNGMTAGEIPSVVKIPRGF
ncbi:MAG: DUF3794 domain-containing protein [Ruminococcaceae bacterium]|nr:DUF3794 domain-containing protein [Oscillospiraceae bacterium]